MWDYQICLNSTIVNSCFICKSYENKSSWCCIISGREGSYPFHEENNMSRGSGFSERIRTHTLPNNDVPV